jgi:hypothetical protein
MPRWSSRQRQRLNRCKSSAGSLAQVVSTFKLNGGKPAALPAPTGKSATLKRMAPNKADTVRLAASASDSKPAPAASTPKVAAGADWEEF